MLTLEQIQKKLINSPRWHAQIAREMGVSRAYISAIARGDRNNPSYGLIKRLSDYFEGQEQGE